MAEYREGNVACDYGRRGPGGEASISRERRITQGNSLWTASTLSVQPFLKNEFVESVVEEKEVRQLRRKTAHARHEWPPLRQIL